MIASIVNSRPTTALMGRMVFEPTSRVLSTLLPPSPTIDAEGRLVKVGKTLSPRIIGFEVASWGTMDWARASFQMSVEIDRGRRDEPPVPWARPLVPAPE